MVGMQVIIEMSKSYAVFGVGPGLPIQITCAYRSPDTARKAFEGSNCTWTFYKTAMIEIESINVSKVTPANQIGLN